MMMDHELGNIAERPPPRGQIESEQLFFPADKEPRLESPDLEEGGPAYDRGSRQKAEERITGKVPLLDEPDLPGYPLLGFLAGASVIRRSAFLEVGGFESRFFIGGEEELLALDLATRGWSLRYVPELVVHHHPSPNRDAASRRWHLLRNALWS